MNNTPNLLRPSQVDETENEISRIEGMLLQPHVEDRAMAIKQLNNLKYQLETFSPTPFENKNKDWAVREEKKLREEMLADGMPTQAEMRKCPPGAVDKLRGWEKRNKNKLATWKYLQLRLHAGSTDSDTANFEKYRPEGGAQELSMHGAVIPGKQYMLPPIGAGPVDVMSDEESKVLKDLDPDLHGMMAVATNEQRSQILDSVRTIIMGEKPKQKRNLSPEQRKKIGERLAEGRAKKAAEKAEAKTED